MADKKVTDKIKKTVHYVVDLLVNQHYDELVHFTNGIQVQTEEIEDAINRYGNTFIAPPEKAYNDLDVIEIENASPRKWSVRFDLWTKEEGKSDLSMELTLIDSDKDLLGVEFDDIHVL